MADTDPTPPDPTPTPINSSNVKPGYKTTEFWFKVAAFVLSCLFASGAITNDRVLAIAGIAASWLTSMGYTVSRTLIKTGAAAIVLLLVVIALQPGCKTVNDCSQPENMNSLKCTAINSALDCGKGELPAVITQFSPLVEWAIKEATGADGSIDTGTLEKALGNMGQQFVSCTVGTVIEGYGAEPRKLAPGEVAPDVHQLRAWFADAKTRKMKLTKSTIVHTKYGDIQ